MSLEVLVVRFLAFVVGSVDFGRTRMLRGFVGVVRVVLGRLSA